LAGAKKMPGSRPKLRQIKPGLPKAYPLLSTATEDRIPLQDWWFLSVPKARFIIPAAFAGLFFAGAAAHAAGEVVTGDSLGVGIAMASGFENRAANSITIRGNRAIEQLRSIRAGSVVYLSLGTNDAVGSVKGIEKSIDAVVNTASAQRLKLIWIGPPCVIKAWDKNAEELDGILKQRLAGTGVTYVSMRDPSLCSASLRGKDGVHFNMAGYKLLWARAASASGIQVASTSQEAPVPAAKKKLRNENPRNEDVTQEQPRVRTIVTSASLAPVSQKKRVVADSQFFSFEFRWPETHRFTGSFVPRD
jgi:lysophospholipase L1-like esterase